MGESLNNLGLTLLGQGRLQEAEALYREALEVRKAALGEAHPDVVVTLSNLGQVLRQQERLGEAGPLLRQALEFRRARLGNDHPLTANSLHVLAAVTEDQGDYRQAEALYREALAIRRRPGRWATSAGWSPAARRDAGGSRDRLGPRGPAVREAARVVDRLEAAGRLR